MLTMRRAVRHAPAAVARGLSLVELLVGIAVGMFVVASAAMLVSAQLNDNRRLLLETQVQQDLRAAADIVTRELRRVGHWPNAAAFVWPPGVAGFQVNPYTALQLDAGPPAQVEFSYQRQNDEPAGQYGFKQDGAVLRTLLSGGGWQELTDGNTLRITGFRITPRDAPQSRLPCPNLCPDGTQDCWPTLTVRELDVDIEGEATSDPSVRRSLRTVVRLRNDLVQFSVPNAGAPTQACPD